MYIKSNWDSLVKRASVSRQTWTCHLLIAVLNRPGGPVAVGRREGGAVVVVDHEVLLGAAVALFVVIVIVIVFLLLELLGLGRPVIPVAGVLGGE